MVKFCEKLSQNGSDTDAVKDGRRETPLKTAQHWERRWHLLYLKCLEWQCYIEEQLNNLKKKKTIEVRNCASGNRNRRMLLHRIEVVFFYEHRKKCGYGEENYILCCTIQRRIPINFPFVAKIRL